MNQPLENISEILKNHKLDQNDYEQIKQILHREPNLLEIAIFSAMWSEHCSYKSSKKYLKGFPTTAPYVIVGPGENAGVIDIGDGYAAVFKIESHNHPSFIEPRAGAATGVGGIMRDIFTMGARPVANLNSIRFGEIYRDDEIGKKHKYLLRGVVDGIASYGNCMGVPTIGGETSFEACYNGNILVNAFTLGIVKNEEIFYGRAEGIGNPVIYVGSKTGADGLGGAVMSSDSFNEDSKSLRPTVQIGDPFTEKLLLEACLELFEKKLIVGIQDMGAAGLSSSSFEMAGRSGSGMIMHLDKVPVREEGLGPYELMLSESQERMLICAKKGFEKEVMEIFQKWELDVEIIGEVTDTGNMELFWNGEKCAQIPIEALSENAPILDRPISKPKYLNEINKNEYKRNTFSQQEIFKKLLSSLDISDKSWIYSQYDSTVQTNTIVSSGQTDASVIRIKENGTSLAMNVNCPVRYCYLDPKQGSAIAVATAGRNCVTRGAKPLAISDCLNFGNPQNPEVMWQFKEATDGIKEAAQILQTPVISGNVSLYNQTDSVDIYPTPTIVSVGLIQKGYTPITSGLKEKGNLLVLLGEIREDFGGSVVQKIIYNTCEGKPPKIDLEKEKHLWELMKDNFDSKIIKSAKDIGKGGLSIALAKMALLGNMGIEIKTAFNSSDGVQKDMIFSESQSCIVVEINPEDLTLLQKNCKKYQIPCSVLGKVGNKNGDICIDSIAMSMSEAKKLFFDSFCEIVKLS
ncbi:phosphoribosylformylglycinamidine synthase subunit PurL [Helicobacter cappadocius]|uniref:Phosphoribosylformylglycinamidine synthase subunit PurL n=1 Tax=Helicobacter cappadocius TaxID=3063998 RepID=A0AA90ST90_9HELI|nr:MULTISPECIES: phosphoribosylformylglycinamidine synthase subunit PurL [unclassified Helicobacter]MDO7253845.1 phosphoribosylformylglycinamidine synthase subunit PurL [Helicobacter sp. faydin-H75]MDP2539734.1 phosphoribosylformylglycinamidine synthase subunit PurL [Helicobacter sp. faydin-H76]